MGGRLTPLGKKMQQKRRGLSFAEAKTSVAMTLRESSRPAKAGNAIVAMLDFKAKRRETRTGLVIVCGSFSL